MLHHYHAGVQEVELKRIFSDIWKQLAQVKCGVNGLGGPGPQRMIHHHPASGSDSLETPHNKEAIKEARLEPPQLKGGTTSAGEEPALVSARSASSLFHQTLLVAPLGSPPVSTCVLRSSR